MLRRGMPARDFQERGHRLEAPPANFASAICARSETTVVNSSEHRRHAASSWDSRCSPAIASSLAADALQASRFCELRPAFSLGLPEKLPNQLGYGSGSEWDCGPSNDPATRPSAVVG